MRTWLLHHLDPPMSGHALPALRRAGLPIAECRVSAGQRLPELEDVAALVVFGGDESACDLDVHPYLAAECELLERVVLAEIPVLGLCLGAQLLARSQGARVKRMDRMRLDWAQPGPLEAAGSDPLFAGAPPIPAPHWHEDAFELPAHAVELQERSGSGVEAFRVGKCAWGVQYHPEVDAAMLDAWYACYPRVVTEAGTTEAAARREDARHLAAQRLAADHLFGAFADVVRSRSRPPATEAPAGV